MDIDVGELKKGFKKSVDFVKQKKVINIFIIVFLLALLIGGIWVRTQNLPLLIDGTTGEYLPVALDPFYFLRVSEAIISEGGLPEYDLMRIRPNWPVEWTNEFLPQANVLLYKIANIFSGNFTLRYINVISPVIYFALSLILFFFLILNLTKSRISAVLGSIFLTIIPSYLYRTMAGFSDHESIGMLGFFAVMLVYALSLNKIDKQNIKMNKIVLFGLLTGFLTTFASAAWGGVAKFVFMIIPISFFLIWIIKFKKTNETKDKTMLNYFVFYLVWFLSTILFSPILSYPFSVIISKITTPSALLAPIMILFMIADYFIIKLRKDNFKFFKKEQIEKFRIVFSFVIAIIVGAILLSFVGINVFGFFGNIINILIRPFGGGRIGSTVAENAQPYLMDWIGQIGKLFLWLFYFGMLFVGFEFSKGIGKKVNRVKFSIVWVLLISGVLFSRISSSSLLNGDNFISKFVYFGGLLLFVVYFIWLYFKDEIKVKNELLIMMVWSVFILLAGRSAIRLFFIVTPLICLMAGYAISRLYHYAKKNKDDLVKTLLFLILILAFVGIIFSSINLAKATIGQAKYTGPSANYQWQNAMSWVRDNTEQGSIFLHWWDYGYWVQYLGERPTLADGGHFQGDIKTHMIGRYVLTTPNPDTAKSFMKANDVSYLLIDPTDLGKYPAYSKIGSDATSNDRYSWLPVIPLNPAQTQETRDGLFRIYPGGTAVDQDIIYNENGTEIFLPEGQAGVAGFILEDANGEFKQPEGVFAYNGNQAKLPIRYLFYNGKLVDFGQGVESTLVVIPSIKNGNGQIEIFGAVIYLSPKVMNSLFAQLYLMNDPNNLYPDLELAHAEDDQVVTALKFQGIDVGEFIYYGGFRGPIKIWEVEHSDDIIAREEFLRFEGEFAELDDLEFRK